MSDSSTGPLFNPRIPNILIRGGKICPALGIGITSTKLYDLSASLTRAVQLEYRLFQLPTYLEKQIGDTIAESLQTGSFVNIKNPFFIISKIQFLSSTCGSESIVTNLKNSVKTMNLEYVDILLIECPEQEKDDRFFITKFSSVWEVMEECMSLGLAKLIGVCNFSDEMLESLLHLGKTIPSVNLVGMNTMWKNKNLREYCSANDITIFVSATLDGSNEDFDFSQFMESENFEQIGKDLQKTSAEIYCRWAYEQGAALLLDSLNEVDMESILNIFDWELSKEM